MDYATFIYRACARVAGDGTYKIWSAKELFAACGVNRLDFSPEQTNAFVYTSGVGDCSTTNYILGRTGLAVQYTADTLFLCRYYDDNLSSGGWRSDVEGIYVPGYYYQLHIYGARYS